MNAETLKKSILQLAVEGKLVPQIDTEEPASVLLEKIREEKEQLIREKKIKRDKNESIIYRENGHFYEKVGKKEPVCIDDEIPFDIPESWEWCRFGEIVQFSMGKTPPRKEYQYWEQAIYPWVSISDIDDGKYIHFTKEFVNEKAKKEIFKNKISKKGTLLMSFKLTVGKVAILNMDAFHNEAIISIYPYYDNNYYMRNFLFKTLPLLSQDGNTKSAIKGKTLNKTSLYELLIPLPPLSEQHRIVDKIEKFSPYIEKYNLAEKEITKLDKDFPDKIKQSVLQYAVEGKLVPQIESEGTAEELLEKIREEKEQLIKDKKIKRDKNESIIYRENGHFYEKVGKKEPVCIDDEIPFDIPASWEWCRLDNIANVKGGKRIPAGRKLTTVETPYKYIRVSDMHLGTVLLEDIHFVPEDIYPKIKNYTISSEDVYITVAGTIGRVGLIPKALDGANLTENADKLELYHGVKKEFLKTQLESPVIQKQIVDVTTKVGQPKLAIKRIKKFLVALPPLEEQHRIVEKIEDILPLIKEL